MFSNRCKEACIYVTGISFIASAIILLILWPSIFQAIIKDEIILKKNSRSYNLWVETPIPMYLEIYMFNWTNYEEFLKNKSIKPKFVECGPYVFSEMHYKTNLTWNDNNNTITFMQKRKWIFQEDKSNGNLNDEILNLNVITATVAYNVREKHSLIRHAVDFFLREENEKIGIKKTVQELLFEGYHDKMIDFVRRLNVTNFNIPYDKFGWFYPRNDSINFDGIYNMETGANDVRDTGILNFWNYNDRTNFYNHECGMVNGTTGELWPPIGNSKQITMFVSDFCRSLSLEYESKLEKHGLVGRKYVGTDRLFDNGTKYPETACFSHEEVLPSGLLNVSMCRFGAPAFVSYPHFYLADPIYTQKIDGMVPNDEKHKFYIALEPNTGIPLEVRAALQLNIMITDYPGISLFNGLKRTFIPMLWFRQTADLTSELANDAKVVVIIPNLGNYTLYGIAAIGFLITCIGLYLTFFGYWVRKNRSLLQPVSSSTDQEYLADDS